MTCNASFDCFPTVIMVAEQGMPSCDAADDDDDSDDDAAEAACNPSPLRGGGDESSNLRA
jgi:hypothetical protein